MRWSSVELPVGLVVVPAKLQPGHDHLPSEHVLSLCAS